MATVLPADAPDTVISALADVQNAADELGLAVNEDVTARAEALSAAKDLAGAVGDYTGKKAALLQAIAVAYPDQA